MVLIVLCACALQPLVWLLLGIVAIVRLKIGESCSPCRFLFLVMNKAKFKHFLVSQLGLYYLMLLRLFRAAGKIEVHFYCA